MAKIFRPAAAKRNKNQRQRVIEARIEHLDHQGQGVVSNHQPIVFATGGLPGEQCQIVIHEQKKHVWLGHVKQIRSSSEERIDPFCPHSEVCGGCQLDYVDPENMREWRRQAITQLLRKIAGLEVSNWGPDVFTEPKGYRRKTRLAIDARQADSIRLGYRQQGSNQVVAISQCQILTPKLQALIEPLQSWLKTCGQARHLGHITLLEGADAILVQVKATRQLSEGAMTSLREFGQQYDVVVALEDKRGEIDYLVGSGDMLNYQPTADIKISIGANDFVQVNDRVNQQMVATAIDWLLDYKASNVLDLFCGTGNFSLSLAQNGFAVTGVEGIASMVERARSSAEQHALQQCNFAQKDLLNPAMVAELLQHEYDAVILDPSREGAKEVCQQMQAKRQPHIVYVSCNPASFARDAKLLSERGYQLEKLSLVEMFAYTKHTELMASFTAQK
ncbi:23S rRNA (uracil(1939)-C(5))-methyltransferase RlmD [Alteromonas sp. ASW11-36]|uniref:23S rRNA (Uracil(1939)-C(5))-methyltransferase RlmD n=1 Tax=Alteromonas arenosi TaxID=3055817 RepID=A0ABT7T047_9ALTE|nr:23S rRNA (uracil(1939)-C(5))-methyltransferase RlmD [Alteromonas sp. ASW11-36]MDM7861821.1 23S rRNA (uracil(1939)-C(5))-methyltransferase RlmD [Alteromonas sp. ASW11-36]